MRDSRWCTRFDAVGGMCSSRRSCAYSRWVRSSSRSRTWCGPHSAHPEMRGRGEAHRPRDALREEHAAPLVLPWRHGLHAGTRHRRLLRARRVRERRARKSRRPRPPRIACGERPRHRADRPDDGRARRRRHPRPAHDHAATARLHADVDRGALARPASPARCGGVHVGRRMRRRRAGAVLRPVWDACAARVTSSCGERDARG